MSKQIRIVKALGLCSGGLDSMCAALLLKRQGIEVEWITFATPFFSAEKARRAACLTGIRLTVENITAEYLPMLKNPACGYGKYMNPCMDCHALMFRLAGELMEAKKIDFLFSGEVLGQRPMSQTRPSLRYVEKHSGFDGLILRPLSAKKLPETRPEKEGLVDRELLLDIAGRSRKRQMQLAREFGISEYPTPAGGCLLTDKGYSARLKDLFLHQETYTENELHLLKYGRHLRLSETVKMIIGRTKSDNDNIHKYSDPKQDILINLKSRPGPTVLLPAACGPAALALAIEACIGYSKAPKTVKAEVIVHRPDGDQTVASTGRFPGELQHLVIQ